MRTIAPMNNKYRVSSDSVWPLRRADGRTFAESKHDLSHHTADATIAANYAAIGRTNHRIASRLADLKHQATKNERNNRRKEFVK